MDFWWSQNSYANLFMLQTFLNATPDFIPIVITTDKYLLKRQEDVKLLQWFAKCSQELPKHMHFQRYQRLVHLKWSAFQLKT